jgi:hypothetical protein
MHNIASSTRLFAQTINKLLTGLALTLAFAFGARSIVTGFFSCKKKMTYT